MAEGKGSEEPVGQGPVLMLSERVSVHREERGGWIVRLYDPICIPRDEKWCKYLVFNNLIFSKVFSFWKEPA